MARGRGGGSGLAWRGAESPGWVCRPRASGAGSRRVPVRRRVLDEVDQPGRDVGDVLTDVGLHGGVDERGHGALVLAVLAEHLARNRVTAGGGPGGGRAPIPRSG